MKRERITLYFLSLIIMLSFTLFSNCAVYYFSAKTLEPKKFEIGVGTDAGFQKNYLNSAGADSTIEDLWYPPLHFYGKIGLPQDYNLSFSMRTILILTGLSAGVSKRIVQTQDKCKELAIEAGVFVLPDFGSQSVTVVDDSIIEYGGLFNYLGFYEWGVYSSLNLYQSMKFGGYSLKLILEYQYIEPTVASDFMVSPIYDRLTMIFLSTFELKTWKNIHIMPYASVLAGIDVYQINDFYLGGQAGLTIFFRSN
ncbi:MAG: hypothetical protein AB7T10_06705 [bacterium]